MKTVSKVERFENARNQFLLWTGKKGSFKNFRSFVDGRRKRIKKFAFLYENELVWEGENKNGNTCGVENIFASFSLRWSQTHWSGPYRSLIKKRIITKSKTDSHLQSTSEKEVLVYITSSFPTRKKLVWSSPSYVFRGEASCRQIAFCTNLCSLNT